MFIGLYLYVRYLQLPVTATPLTVRTGKIKRVSLKSLSVKFFNKRSSFCIHFICNDIVGAAVGLTEGFAVGFGEGSALGLTVLASVDGAAVGLSDGNDDDGSVFVYILCVREYRYRFNVNIMRS